ncbi:alpha/beta fold hydrolase [Nocardioides sp. KIGAM211]|uniref:Alpha/beta fold hydrolase n=1 Tax=Nocardioides luti TaxID=2761101 RepID=A0A7X0VAJ1_9ACTN|nr:alpha/beta hydrolase [Nocardioides luti]MBB6627405.1 alpha/beta fold hydrolase [Nocardioides luti]
MTDLHHRLEGSGPTVVLLHAGVADLRMWDTQVAELVPGHAVLRLDLRGYGSTPLEPGTSYSDAEDVLALLDELGIDRFALVGASYGGYVAQQVASAVPERLDALVLLDAPADLAEPDPALRALWQEEGRLLVAGDLDGATDLNVATWVGPDADDDARALVWKMQRAAFAHQVPAGDVENRELPIDLAAITCPTTVVVGAHDLEFFRENARELVAALPRAELVELPWALHLPSLERPFETAHLVRAALG